MVRTQQVAVMLNHYKVPKHSFHFSVSLIDTVHTLAPVGGAVHGPF